MKKLIFVFALFFCFSLIAKVDLFHEPSFDLDVSKGLELELIVRSGYNEIDKATVYYRETGSLSYFEADMDLGSETNPICSVRIKELKNFKGGLDYYFSISTITNQTIMLPKVQAEQNPFHVIFSKDNYFNDFIRISPDNEFSDSQKDFILAISFFNAENSIDLSTLQLILNGKDVTKKATISNNMIVYKPQKVRSAKHIYHLNARLRNGKKVHSKRWETTVRKAEAKNIVDGDIIELNGNSYLSYIGNNTKYESSDLDSSGDDRINFGLNLYSRYNWLRFKSKLYITSLEDKKKQSVNRYNFQFDVPHFKLVIGDYTPNMGSFILSGKNVRGFSSIVNLENLRFLATYGSTRRTVNGEAITDTTFSAGAFNRKTMAVSTEIGSKTGFSFGFSFVKNKDDVNSLNEQYYLAVAKDSLANCIEGVYDENNPMLMPNDNIVFGVNTDFRFYENRLTFGAETAFSMYNSNIIGGSISQDDLEDFLGMEEGETPFDPESLENIFVINKNVEPFILGKTSLAYKGFAKAFFYNNFLNINYSVIGSSFKSLSTNYLQTGASTLTIVDNYNLSKYKINVNIGLNLISDNPYGEKEVTTNSTGFFSNFYYNPPDLPYFKFGVNRNSSKNDADDSDYPDFESELSIKSNSYYVGFGYELGRLNIAPTKLSFNLSNYSNSDEAYERYRNKRNSITISGKSFFNDIPLITLLSYTFTQNNDTMPDTANVLVNTKPLFNSIYFKANYLLVDNKLKPFFDFRFTGYGGDGIKQSSKMFNIGAEYAVLINMSLYSDFGIRSYDNKDVDDVNYSNYNWKFKIKYKF